MHRTDQLTFLKLIAEGAKLRGGYQFPAQRLEEMFASGGDDRITDPALRRLQVIGMAGADGDISSAEPG